MDLSKDDAIAKICCIALEKWNNLPIEFRDTSYYSDYEAGFIDGAQWKEKLKETNENY